jgi:aspartyl-tRNA(Asn)/glutamyl-tRNA(Gln) amidotransferase subunit A
VLVTALHDLTVSEASVLIAARDISPVELVDAVVARADAVDGVLHTMITRTTGRARAQALRAEREIAASGPRSPLHGIPYGLKDNFHAAGIRTTANSRLMLDHIATESATAHERLEAAGAILVGKLGTWEFGTGDGADAAAQPFPHVRNPWNTAHFPGGSSTGVGAAVAAGTVLFGLGADTGGSIRLPAAACGVYGLKPTYGLVSRAGVVPNAPSLDHIGPLTRTAADAALVMGVIAGHDERDAMSARRPVPDFASAIVQPLGDLRVGITHALDDPNADPAQLRAMLEAAQTLERLGASLVPVDLPAGQQDFINCQRVINIAECFSVHREIWLAGRDVMGPSLADKLAAGACITAAEYLRAQRWRRLLVEALDLVFVRCDVLLSAAVATPAPLLADNQSVADAVTRSSMSPFSMSGHPALSVPAGFSDAGLPLALQLAAPHFADAHLLAVAHAYERATGWSTRRPVIGAAPMIDQPLPAPPPLASDHAAAMFVAKRAGITDPKPRELDRFVAQIARTAAMVAYLPAAIAEDVMPHAPSLT